MTHSVHKLVCGAAVLFVLNLPLSWKALKLCINAYNRMVLKMSQSCVYQYNHNNDHNNRAHITRHALGWVTQCKHKWCH